MNRRASGPERETGFDAFGRWVGAGSAGDWRYVMIVGGLSWVGWAPTKSQWLMT
jgi:hypothetical protein